MQEDFITNALTPTTDIAQDKSPEQQEFERDESLKDRHLAALKDHPGWKLIRELMEKDIEDFKSLKGIDMSRYKNDELGEVVRSERTVAAKLEEYLQKIDAAVEAVVRSSGRKEG